MKTKTTSRIRPWALACALLLASRANGVAQDQPRKEPEPGWIGIAYELRYPQARDEPLPSDAALLVILEVQDKSPAALAGLEPGDTVIRIEHEPVSAVQMKRFGERLRVGDRVHFTVQRDQRRRDLAVVAGRRPQVVLFYPRGMQQQIVIRVDSVRDAILRSLDSVRANLEKVRFEFDTAAYERMAEELERMTVVYDSLIPALEIRFERIPGQRSDSLEAELRRMQREQIEALRQLERAPAREARGRASDSIAVQARQARQEALRPSAQARRQRPVTDSVRAAGERARTPQPPEVHVFFAPEIVGQRVVAGAHLTTLNPELGDYFGVGRGLLVTDVMKNTPAAAAGLVAGDVITVVEGREVTSISELRTALARASRPAPITVVRKRKPIELRLPE